jgi:anti-anti-sigma factor
VRLRLHGELDLGHRTAGRPTPGDTARQGADVVLDLDELAFIDMSGLRMLDAAAEDAARNGWAFTVTGGSAAVRRLIDFVQLGRPLPLDKGSR